MCFFDKSLDDSIIEHHVHFDAGLRSEVVGGRWELLLHESILELSVCFDAGLRCEVFELYVLLGYWYENNVGDGYWLSTVCCGLSKTI